MSLDTPEAAPPPSRQVLPWLNVLRLLCALEIVGFHWLRATYRLGLFGCAGALNVVADYQDTRLALHGFAPVLSQACKPHATALINEVLGVLFGYGWEAVNVFIVISGFVLALGLPSARPSGFWRQWYSRRLTRILLPYYRIALPFITVFILLLHLPGKHAGLLGRFQAKLSTLFSGGILSTYLTHIFLIDPTRRHWVVAFFSPAWWFVPAILVAYLFFPAFVALIEKLGTRTFLLAAFCLTVCAYQLTATGYLVNNGWYFVVLNECFGFSLGIAAGSLWRHPESRATLQRALGGSFATLLGFALVLLGNVGNWFRAAYPFSSPIFTLGLCLIGFQLSTQLARSRRVRAVASLDAYLLYLLHQPLATPFAIVSLMLLRGRTAALGLPLYLAFCCGLTWLVQRLTDSGSKPRRILRSTSISPRAKPADSPLVATTLSSSSR